MSPKSRATTTAETREALIFAALELFATEGLAGPSIGRISEHAGYTRGAFYGHFPTRQDLVLAVIERIWDGWAEVAQRGLSGDGTRFEGPLGGFGETVRQVFDDPDADPVLKLGLANVGLVFQAARQDEGIATLVRSRLQHEVQRLGGLVALGRQAGLVRDDLDPEALAELLLTVGFGVFVMAPAGLPTSFERLADVLAAVLRPR